MEFLSLSRSRYSSRNVHSGGEERGGTAIFAGYVYNQAAPNIFNIITITQMSATIMACVVGVWKGREGSFRRKRNARGARGGRESFHPSLLARPLFSRAQNPLSLPFQTPATQLATTFILIWVLNFRKIFTEKMSLLVLHHALSISSVLFGGSLGIPQLIVKPSSSMV